MPPAAIVEFAGDEALLPSLHVDVQLFVVARMAQDFDDDLGFNGRALRTGIQNAGIYLPRGQLTHVMRHTFAVHFMREKGSIFDLQKILGHKTLKMTLRYAKFHPDYLADAIHKNPIAIMERSGMIVAA
ncbi:tyrosine-type recombinase/integrase [Marinomonas spartinae]|uniref:tyrosine-type recombinase/integrase n=1 Tax=Marinomonas spartinae TaxID=1792290 RepID=UPI001FE025E5|nr:tyrosine-type recombinase/integrase [Marinomonas spartinae]